jgi:hypothetical protein
MIVAINRSHKIAAATKSPSFMAAIVLLAA